MNRLQTAIVDFLHEQSKSSFETLFQCEGVSLEVLKSDDRSKELDWCAYILVTFDEFSLIFRAFYRIDEITPFVAKNLAKKEEEIDGELVKNFVKEYCNLTAGSLKGCLEETLEVNVQIGKLSVPQAELPHRLSGEKEPPLWKLSLGDKVSLFCQLLCHIPDDYEPKGTLDLSAALADKDSGIDFF